MYRPKLCGQWGELNVISRQLNTKVGLSLEGLKASTHLSYKMRLICDKKLSSDAVVHN